jgi:predicted acylesterase/phospholipase RssA
MLTTFAPPDGYTGPRRSLVLAGGGMRVAWQCGVLQVLARAGLQFAHIDATSGGTINLAMLLSGHTPDDMARRWRTLNVRDFASLPPLQQYLRARDRLAWGSAHGVVGRVFPHLGIDVAAVNQARGLIGTFNVCNFSDKTVESMPHEAIDRDRLVAAISLPMFLPPVRRDSAWYTDAVWIKDANLMEAVRQGAEEIWLIWCIGNTRTYKPGAFNQYVHMIEMSANGALFEEFAQIRALNDRIARGEVVDGRTRPIVLHVIKPEYPLPLDPDFYFGRISSGALIDDGYLAATRYLSSRSTEGVPWTPAATVMRDSGIGAFFSETMAGPLTLGVTAPEQGAKPGAATAAIHVRIVIDDLAAFIADPQHAGRIGGDVDLPPFGKAIPALGGTFKLFAPTSDLGTTWMVYEVAFEHEGRPYYLAGRKHVGGGHSLLAVWRDTTTLFTTLHEGNDASGPVIGAGVLTLGVRDLLRLAGTFTSINAAGLAERIGVVARFVGFFIAQLWRVYVRRPAATNA